jgi:hypothetical protein
MTPVDLQMQHYEGYVRYVDDVRLLGKTENEVRGKLIDLERHCRERGLIPQAGKFAIKRAHNIQEALGMLPSISDPHNTEGTKPSMDKKDARQMILTAIEGKPYRVADKTRFRFVLYRAEPDAYLLKLALRLIPLHPEHADVLFIYLNKFGYRKPIERLCADIIISNPYAYLRGEAWHILAKYNHEPKALVASDPQAFIEKAINVAKDKSFESMAERWGACHFLCTMETRTSKHLSRWAKHQPSLLQSLLAPALPDSAFTKGEAVEEFLRRTAPEPGLSLSPLLHEQNVAPSAFSIMEDELPSQVKNTLRELGLIVTSGAPIDPIAEILHARYDVPKGRSWHDLLNGEYVHALGLLKQAEAAFDSGRSHWLACQNSFNQTLFLALQNHFTTINHPASCKTIDRNGEMINFGVTLDANGSFSKNCPIIADCFREVNARRNCLPAQHPYEKKTKVQTQFLGKVERDQLVRKLRTAYQDFEAHMP